MVLTYQVRNEWKPLWSIPVLLHVNRDRSYWHWTAAWLPYFGSVPKLCCYLVSGGRHGSHFTTVPRKQCLLQYTPLTQQTMNCVPFHDYGCDFFKKQKAAKATVQVGRSAWEGRKLLHLFPP